MIHVIIYILVMNGDQFIFFRCDSHALRYYGKPK